MRRSLLVVALLMLGACGSEQPLRPGLYDVEITGAAVNGLFGSNSIGTKQLCLGPDRAKTFGSNPYQEIIPQFASCKAEPGADGYSGTLNCLIPRRDVFEKSDTLNIVTYDVQSGGDGRFVVAGSIEKMAHTEKAHPSTLYLHGTWRGAC